MGSKISWLKNKSIEYIKFNIEGTINFILSQIFYIFLHLVFNIHYIFAYTITSLLSVIASYYFNSKYTFKQNNHSVSKLSFSILIYVFEYMLNLFIIIFLVHILNFGTIIAPIIAPVFSTPVVFILMRKVLNNSKKD